MKVRTIRTMILATAIVGVMTVGGIMAYFTDADTTTNTFTVGKISLDLQEPDWEPEDGKNLTPGKTVTKNPQIENDGTNPAFIFAEVILPYAKVVTANEDGSKNEAADTELFRYMLKEGWTELEAAEWDEKTHQVTHRYVYGSEEECRELAAGETTPVLFNEVTFVNVVEGALLEGSTQEIVINAYGIQTTDIDGGKRTPADVWSILATQHPELEVSGTEDSKTDKKQ